MTAFCPRCGSLIMPGKDTCSRCNYKAGEETEIFIEEAEETPRLIQPKVIKTENPELPCFPYIPRPIQVQIVKDITKALDEGKHIVLESGTGTGKTIVSLASAVDHASRTGKKVIYLTRTISQSDQVMRELRAISKIRRVSGLALTGRGRSCPFLRTMPNYEKIPPAALSAMCEDSKKKALTNSKGGCPYFVGITDRLDEAEQYCRTEFPTSGQLDKFCEERRICPYEMKKMLMKSVNVIVAPYVHVLSDAIRKGFLGNIESDGSDLIVIVDEAHNIIDAAREQESYTIDMKLIDAAVDEITTMKGDPPLFEGVTLRPFLKELRTIIKSIATEKLTFSKKEDLVGSNEIEDRLCKKFEMTKSELGIAVDWMIDLGQERSDLLIERGENRMSEILTLGTDLKNWIMSDPGKYIKTISADDEGEFIHAACIDPYDVTHFLRNVKGAVHMSGTLEPLEQYVKVMGLPADTVTKVYPSPFPPENKSVIYLGNVTTRYDDMQRDPSIFSRMEKNVAKLCNNVNKNTLVFFPSYSMMRKMRPFLERDVKKELYWEESGQQKLTMRNLSDFRKGRDGVFFTVMGGSIAEGIDFPGDELCFAIIIGIPYPPPTLEMRAMSDMFDKKYGRGTGWRYTSEVPALRKMQQAIGRLIRTETDRGMAVIFDNRCSKYASRLGARLSEDPLGDMVEFFRK